MYASESCAAAEQGAQNGIPGPYMEIKVKRFRNLENSGNIVDAIPAAPPLSPYLNVEAAPRYPQMEIKVKRGVHERPIAASTLRSGGEGAACSHIV